MKYIIFKNSEDWEVPVIFPKAVNHSNMALKNANLGKPISAGFIGLNHDGTLSAFGESVSLSIKSRPEDLEIINKAIKAQY